MRRPQPRHPTALLVDEDRCIVTADAFAQRGDQLTDLTGRETIAPEQNEAGRSARSKEITLESVQAFAATAQDDRTGRLIEQ